MKTAVRNCRIVSPGLDIADGTLVWENGRIVSLLGVYPLPAVIAGRRVLLGTIGNVASLPSARGKGYMKQLMAAA